MGYTAVAKHRNMNRVASAVRKSTIGPTTRVFSVRLVSMVTMDDRTLLDNEGGRLAAAKLMDFSS